MTIALACRYNLAVKILVAVALALLACGAPVHAQDRVEELEAELESARGTERVRLLNLLAREVQINAPRDSIAHAQEALELAESLGDVEGQAAALNTLGIAHYLLAEYNTALDYYRDSLPLAEQAGNDEGVANALNNIGVIHYMWGEYDRTLEYYSRVLEIRKRTGDKHGMAVCHNNLGNVYYATQRYDEALQHLSEALELYTKTGDERLAASTLNNIGLLYHDLERFDDALHNLERALVIEERINDKPGIALSLNNIGMVYDAWDKHREALDYYQRSLRVREKIGDRQGAGICRQNIGLAYAALGDFDRALDYQTEALEIATALNIREMLRDAHLGLSETYERMGDFEQALESYRRYQEVNAELFDEETGRRLAELQARFEVERKDREIEVLVKNQEIQRTVRNAIVVVSVLLLILVVSLYIGYRLKARANREMKKTHKALKIAQAERERAARAELTHVSRVATLGELAAVLAHELNQPLTAILANSQAARRLLASDRADREDVDEALADIVAGAGHASDIIKRLRELLRRGDVTREPLDVNATIRDVETFALAAARRHDATLTLNLADGLPRVSGDRVQLQQIVLNLVHNAAEAMETTAEAERAIVVTTSLEADATVLVAVRDAGSAPDDRVLHRMFEPFFSTKTEGLGMGLPICQTIVESHGGRLWASRNPDRGLTVQFTVPADTGDRG
jgi:signal transduction histidine kinase